MSSLWRILSAVSASLAVRAYADHHIEWASSLTGFAVIIALQLLTIRKSHD